VGCRRQAADGDLITTVPGEPNLESSIIEIIVGPLSSLL